MVSFSVIIITHGREDLLMKCLESLRPPVENWQLILYGNGKELSSSVLEKAKALTKHFTPLHTTEYLTPGRARNLTLKSAEGEWIYFIDDDAFLLRGYWDVLLPLLSDSRIQVLGGPDSPPEDMGPLSLSLATALSSPFCTGVTSSRHRPLGKGLQKADEERLTSCNLWIKKAVIQETLFPEDFLRAEEVLFLQRLKSNGVGMYYHPKLKVAHYRRTKLKELWRPTFYAGLYRSRLMREKVGGGAEAFWLPAIFVLLHGTLFFAPDIFCELVRLYAGIIFFVSLGLALRARKLWLFPLIAFFHYFIVFVYGVGFLAERLKLKK